MRLLRLDALPELQVPSGYALRTFRPGDEHGWAELTDGVIGSWDAESARTRFLAEPGVEPRGIFFLMRGGEYAATATAKRRVLDGPATGYVHMVAVAPAHRGAGLGYAVTLAVLHRFRDQGCRHALLHTDDDRLAAIRTYLKLGFAPDYDGPDHEERWRRVIAELARYRRQGG